MKKRKILYLAGLGLATSLALTGCKKKTTEETISIIETLEKPAPQTFKPHEHIYIERKVYIFRPNDKYQEFLEEKSMQIEVPEGYEKTGEEYIVDRDSFGNPDTIIIDIWFTNTKTVEAEAVYNPRKKEYEYSQPGKVIELEKEDNTKTLK